MRLLDELGLWERFEAQPHSNVTEATLEVSPGRSVTMVDFRRRRQPHPYVAMVPTLHCGSRTRSYGSPSHLPMAHKRIDQTSAIGAEARAGATERCR
jgi:hypothetical protein